MTNTYTDIFGGTAVSASNPSYSTVTLSANTTYTWPGTIDGSNPLGDIMNVTATAGSLKFIMPPGNQGSTGASVLFVNKGSNSFQVVANDGVTAIVTITAGQGVYVYLTDNTTSNGTFNTVGLGTGTSSPDAASLAGYGLTVSATTLNTAYSVTTQSANYAVLSANRAGLLTWTGGAGSFTMSLASTMGNNFFYLASNQGTGALSIIPTSPDTIDGATPSIALNPGESCFVVCSGSTWYTVGRGRSNTFAYSILSKNVAGSANVTLTTAEAANLIHTYSGVLTGNINVILPTVVQQYTIYNNTTGSFTLTVKTASGTGFVITQGYRVIVYCDGTNILSSSTLSTGTVSSIGITPPAAGIAVSGSPVTTVGNITLALADDLAALEGLTGTGYANRTGTSSWTVSNSLSSSSVNFTGGTIDNTPVGATTRSTGAFTTFSSNGITQFLASHGNNIFGTYTGTTSALVALIADTSGFGVLNGLYSNQNIVASSYTAYNALASAPIVATGITSAIVRGVNVYNATLTGSGAITNQVGLQINALSSGSTTNVGIQSLVSSGATGAWNILASGSANNAFAGNTRFGSSVAPTVAVDITGSVLATGTIRSNGNTSGVGYATGAGQTQTQLTSRTTGVSTTTICGQITTFSKTTTAGTFDSFTVTNANVAATDVIIVNFTSGATADKYNLAITAVAAGSFRIQIHNVAAVAVAEAPIINYAIFKSVNA